MKFSCSRYHSKKKPYIVRYYSPKIVRCQKCGYTNFETKFITKFKDIEKLDIKKKNIKKGKS